MPPVFERIRPFLEVMGKRFYYCGGPGMGLHAKLSQNLILSNLLQGFNEGMVLAAKAGVDPALMLDILDNSAAKSGLVSAKAPLVLRRAFEPAFSVKWMHKDIGLMLDSATEFGVPVPLDRPDPSDVSGVHCQRPRGRRHLRHDQGIREIGRA